MGLQIKQKNSNNRIVFLRIQTKDKENLQEKIQRKDTKKRYFVYSNNGIPRDIGSTFSC